MLPITFEWREISSVTACVHRSWFYDDGKVCTDWFAELGWLKKSLQQDSFPRAKTQFNQQLTNPSSGQQGGGCKCWGGAIWLMDKNVYSWHKHTEIHILIYFPILSTNTRSSLLKKPVWNGKEDCFPSCCLNLNPDILFDTYLLKAGILFGEKGAVTPLWFYLNISHLWQV